MCLGDFRQILPTIRTGNRSQIVNARFKRATLFLLFRTLQLNPNMRLWALYVDENANGGALKSPSYLLKVDEDKCRFEEKKQSDFRRLSKIL